jgi:hypothetical protein
MPTGPPGGGSRRNGNGEEIGRLPEGVEEKVGGERLSGDRQLILSQYKDPTVSANQLAQVLAQAGPPAPIPPKEEVWRKNFQSCARKF